MRSAARSLPLLAACAALALLLLLAVTAASATTSRARLVAARAAAAAAAARHTQAPPALKPVGASSTVLNEQGKGNADIKTSVEHCTQSFKLKNQNVFTHTENNVIPAPTGVDHDYTKDLESALPKNGAAAAGGDAAGNGANGANGDSDRENENETAAEALSGKTDGSGATTTPGKTPGTVSITASGLDIPSLPKLTFAPPQSVPPPPEVPALPPIASTPEVAPFPVWPNNQRSPPPPKLPLPPPTPFASKTSWSPAQVNLGPREPAQVIGVESSDMTAPAEQADQQPAADQPAPPPQDNFHFAGMCTIAPNCSPGWVDRGVAGVITRNEEYDGSPFAKGSPFNGQWKWVHPSLCCTDSDRPDIKNQYVLANQCPQGAQTVGYGGVILTKADYGKNPFGRGAEFNSAWDWSHPQLCRTPTKKLLRKPGVTTCIFASQCQRQWVDHGWTGIIVRNQDLQKQPYNVGAVFNAQWKWVHPKLCCV